MMKEISWRFSIITTAKDRAKWILKTMFELMLAKITGRLGTIISSPPNLAHLSFLFNVENQYY